MHLIYLRGLQGSALRTAIKLVSAPSCQGSLQHCCSHHNSQQQLAARRRHPFMDASSSKIACQARSLDEQQQLSASIEAPHDDLAEAHQLSKQQQDAEGNGDWTGGQQHRSGEQQSKKRAKPQPTHLIALQVSQSPEVVSAIKQVQTALVEACPQLQPCLLEPVTAHLTVMVLQLTTQKQMEAAGTLLAELGLGLQHQQWMVPLQLELRGLSHFRNQVLYLDVAEGPGRDNLLQLAQHVMQHFRAAGLMIEEGRGFTPHITVAKTSRLIGKRRTGGRSKVKIPADAWALHADLAAGCVSVEEIQICSMQGRKAGQYYRVTHRLPLLPAVASAAAAAVGAAKPQAAIQEQGAAGEAAAAVVVKEPPAGPLTAARKRFKRLLSAVVCGRPGAQK